MSEKLSWYERLERLENYCGFIDSTNPVTAAKTQVEAKKEAKIQEAKKKAKDAIDAIAKAVEENEKVPSKYGVGATDNRKNQEDNQRETIEGIITLSPDEYTTHNRGGKRKTKKKKGKRKSNQSLKKVGPNTKRGSRKGRRRCKKSKKH